MSLTRLDAPGKTTTTTTKVPLSRKYTNHCIRVTMVTILKEQGFSNVEICSMTGHKKPLSVERYNRKKRDSEIAEMSSALQMGSSSKYVAVEKV